MDAFLQQWIQDQTKLDVYGTQAATRALCALEMRTETPWDEKKHLTLQVLIFEALPST